MRWFARLRAFWGGYFWLPCPICDKNFGGHETGSRGLYIGDSLFESVCTKCVAEADFRNKCNPDYVSYINTPIVVCLDEGGTQELLQQPVTLKPGKSFQIPVTMHREKKDEKQEEE